VIGGNGLKGGGRAKKIVQDPKGPFMLEGEGKKVFVSTFSLQDQKYEFRKVLARKRRAQGL